MGDNRSKIAAIVGAKGSEVSKKGGEMWKTLAAAAKVPYEKRAQEQKDAYEKFAATDEGKKALAEKKTASAEVKADKTAKIEAKEAMFKAKEERQTERACKAAVNAVEKDDALKKPCSAYWLWLSANRPKIIALVGGKGSDVAKKGGEMWKAVSAAEKLPFDKQAKEQKDAYDKYVGSAAGAAALKAFKDAKSAAQDEFKPKEDPAVAVAAAAAAEAAVAAPAAVAAAAVGTKRKAKEVVASPEKDMAAKDVEPAAKKARGRPAKAAKMGA